MLINIISWLFHPVTDKNTSVTDQMTDGFYGKRPKIPQK